MEEIKVYVFARLGKQWVPAGLLKCAVEDGEVVESRFRYGQKYLQRKDAFPVDIVALPLIDAEFKTDPPQDLFSGIKDSSPDSWGRALMERRAGRPMREDELLLASSDYRVGALAFSTDISGPRRQMPWSEAQEAPDVIRLEDVYAAYLKISGQDQREIEQAMRQYILPGSPLGGARPKAVVSFEGRLWIAKFQKENDLFDFVRCEHACMSLAARCGLRVPRVKIEKVSGRSVYLIERFDRRDDDERLPLNSFFSILKETELSFMHSSYAEIADALKKYSRKDAVDRRELFGRMLFNGFCRNTDDHLRNHAMIYEPKLKSFELSPLYDVVCDVTAGFEFRLAIGCGRDAQGRITRAFTREGALGLAPEFGLENAEAAQMYDAMRALVSRHWQKEFIASGFSASETEKFAAVFAPAPAAPTTGI